MRSYRIFLLISGVTAFAQACAFSLTLVYQFQTVGLGPLELVLLGTVLEVTCLVAQVPTGVIADLYSRRLSVIVGVLLTGAGVLLEGLVPTFSSFVIGSIVWGIGATCIDGAMEAWAADEIGPERIGNAFARGAQVEQAATVLGIGAAIGLASVQLNLPLLAGAGAWLGLGVVLILAMPEHSFTRTEASSWSSMKDQVVAGIRAVRGKPVLGFLLGATVFVAMASEGIDRLGQPHFLADLGFPALASAVVWLGVLRIFGMVGSIGLTEVVRRRTDSLHADRVGRVFVVFQALTVVAVVMFAVAGQFWLAAVCWVAIGLLRSACEPLMRTWMVAHTEPATRATVFSAAGMADAAGEIGGGPPVGFLGQRYSIRLALVVSGLVMAPAVGFLAAALTRQRAGGEPPRVLAATGTK